MLCSTRCETSNDTMNSLGIHMCSCHFKAFCTGSYFFFSGTVCVYNKNAITRNFMHLLRSINRCTLKGHIDLAKFPEYSIKVWSTSIDSHCQLSQSYITGKLRLAFISFHVVLELFLFAVTMLPLMGRLCYQCIRAASTALIEWQ